MQWPIVDIVQIVAVGALIFLVARSRPAALPDAGTLQALLAQLHTMTAERDHWRELAHRVELRCQDLERSVAVDRKTIERLHQDADVRRQTIR